MLLHEIEGKNIKLSANTITVKDDAGKTRGLIRGITRFKEARPNVQMQFFKVLRASGLWEAGKSDSVYIDGKELVYIENKRTSDHYNNTRMQESFPEEWGKYKDLMEAVKASGIKVYHCYL